MAAIGGSVSSGSGITTRSDGKAVFFRGADGRLFNTWHVQGEGWKVAAIG